MFAVVAPTDWMTMWAEMNECRVYAIYLALLSVIVLTYEWMERQWEQFMWFFTNAAMIEDTHSIYDLIKTECDNPK